MSKIDQTAAMQLIEHGLKSGDIRGSVALAFEDLLDQARRSKAPENGPLPYRCWVLVGADGVELVNSAHFGLEQHGHKLVGAYHPEDLRASLRVVQRDAPCVLLVCSCCKLPYDATEVVGELEGEGEPVSGSCAHFPNADAAAKAGVDAGWVALSSHERRCKRCANYTCECSGMRDYVDMMTGAKKLIINYLWPELEKLRQVEHSVRAHFDKVGEITRDSDVEFAVGHVDAEHELDRIQRALRSLRRLLIEYDDELARELEQYTRMPHARLRDPRFSEEPPF